ncbi:hypothetical protein BH23ACT12_BH23ACT12_00840 [soil metagenome]
MIFLADGRVVEEMVDPKVDQILDLIKNLES